MMRHKAKDVLFYENLTKLFMTKLVQENQESKKIEKSMRLVAGQLTNPQTDSVATNGLLQAIF